MVTLSDQDKILVDALKEEFPQAQFLFENKYLLSQVKILLEYLKGKEPHCDLPLDVKGTAFQKRVWDELRKIPYGKTYSL